LRYDVIVHNGMIVTVNPDFEIFRSGFVCVKDGRIERIEHQVSKTPIADARVVIDAQGGIVLPGLVNTHTHLPMTLFRGLADDLSLMDWLNHHIFPAEAKHINPDSVSAGTLLGCAEMLLSGTTTCCDGYFHENSVAEAVERTGMRAVLAQGVIDFPAPGVPDPADNVEYAAAYTASWMHRNPRIRPSVFCHSPYTCSADTLKRAKTAANEKGVLFQIHVAETRTERDQILKEHGLSPVQYLDRLGILDPDTLLVHAVWVDAADIETIAHRGAKVSHTPGSNMKLAAGVAPVPAFIKAGVCTGIGTDGSASNNNLDLFQEMNLTAKVHKVHTLDPTVADARTVLEMATINGACAIGLGADIGSLETGKSADIIVVNTRQPHLMPLYSPVSHLVYCASGADVRDVIVSGQVVVRNRNLLTLDLEGIFDRVAAIAREISNGKDLY
jgi:5-methylthioadenosine/S-adenosylhomocysteine deaminase